MSSPPTPPLTSKPPTSGWTQRLFKEWLILSLCFPAVLILILIWNIVGFGYLGLIQQMIPNNIVSLPSTTETPPIDLIVPATFTFWLERCLFAIGLYLIVRPVVHYLENHSVPLALRTAERTEEEITVITRLRIRAAMLKASAAFTLLLIVGLMIVGMLAFVGADRLSEAAFDAPAPSTPPTTGKDADPRSPKPKAQDLPKQTTEIGNTASIISTLSTRLGAVLILIFLVRLLVNLYRYNCILSAYNDSRADAIQFVGKNPTELKKIIPLISAELVRFDEQPKGPLEELAAGLKELKEVAKDIADKVKSEKKPE